MSRRKISLPYCKELFAEVFGEINDKMQVVDGGEVEAEDFASTEEVREVGFGVGLGDVAGTERIND